MEWGLKRKGFEGSFGRLDGQLELVLPRLHGTNANVSGDKSHIPRMSQIVRFSSAMLHGKS